MVITSVVFRFLPALYLCVTVDYYACANLLHVQLDLNGNKVHDFFLIQKIFDEIGLDFFFPNVFIFLMWWTLLLGTPFHMVNVLIIAIVYSYFVFILRIFFFFVKLFSVLKWVCCVDEWIYFETKMSGWMHWRTMGAAKTCDWLLLFHDFNSCNA